MIFHSTHCIFLRKPPHLASTRGKEQCFLDLVFEEENIEAVTKMPWSRDDLEEEQQHLFTQEMNTLNILPLTWAEGSSALELLSTTFIQEQEYGLLNRLDTPTSWLLYFAKTTDIYTQRKTRQAEEKINKYYIAQIHEPITPQVITTPLAHHTNGKRMIVATPEVLKWKKKQKIKGKLLPSETHITLIDKINETTYAHIMINKWWRHQIRAHFASIWSPIIGEQLYDTSLISPLQLFSAWCIVK